MLANRPETPRPRPPARVRRISQIAKNVQQQLQLQQHHTLASTPLKSEVGVEVEPLDSTADLNTTPPPAYHSEFTSHVDGGGSGGSGGGGGSGGAISRTSSSHGARQHRLDDLLGSPMEATLTKLGWETMGVGIPSALQKSAASNHTSSAGAPMGLGERQPSFGGKKQALNLNLDQPGWVSERSRGELEQLVGKAGDIIREREHELGLTAAVCKNLYDSNVALKQKHQTLLGRLPQSPVGSPAISTVPLYRSTSGSLKDSPDPAISAVASPQLTYRGHNRKVSVTPQDISTLADQNAELLDKLERLEAESHNSDQSGRRVLKRLEKEISILREELEKTQVKSQELEEKAKSKKDAEAAAEEIFRKKKEREARVRAMRYNTHDQLDEEDELNEIRDYAPANTSFGLMNTSIERVDSRGGNLPASPSVDWAQSLAAMPENALVSQLLSKIQELEDTNNRILQQQLETKNQLQAVQRDTENMSRVYEALADQPEVEVELVEQHSTPPERPVRRDLQHLATEDTVRYRSFRLTPVQRPASSFEPDRMRDALAAHKARKSVMGLFEGGRERPAQFAQPIPMRLPVPFSSSHKHSWSVNSNDLASPALSSLDLASPLPNRLPEMFSLDSGIAQTLESELAGELNSNWGTGSRAQHLRSTSLYDLANWSPSAVSSPAPLAQSLAAPHPDRSSLLAAAADEFILPPHPRMGLEELSMPEESEVVDPAGSIGRRSERYQRMTETLRSRTSRWVDGRFTGGHNPDSLLPSPPASQLTDDDRFELGADRNRKGKARADSLAVAIGSDRGGDDDDNDDDDGTRPPTPLPVRLATAIDSVLESFHGRLASSDSTPKDTHRELETSSRGSPTTPFALKVTSPTAQFFSRSKSSGMGGVSDRDKERSANATTAVVVAAGAVAKGPKKQGVVGFVLEMWLWLQFMVIIMVFLFAMAKRGPKSVLGESTGAGGRRIAGKRSS